jgi:hypothetical protein
MRTPAFLLLTALAACGGSADAPDDEDIGSVSSAVFNQSITNTKICAVVARDTLLHDTPTSNEPDAVPLKAKSANDGKSIYVFLQYMPGVVNGRVWVDPAINGLRNTESDREMDELAERCGLEAKTKKLSRKSARAVALRAVENKKLRRGWVDIVDLKATTKKWVTVAKAPNGSIPEQSDLANFDAAPVMHVKAGCLPTGEYRGRKQCTAKEKKEGCTERGTHFQTYGTCRSADDNGACIEERSEIYINYNTPEIAGGGVTFAALPVNQEVRLLGQHQHAQRGRHCQLGEGTLDCNAVAKTKATPMQWASVGVQVDAKTRMYGFLPLECLQ